MLDQAILFALVASVLGGAVFAKAAHAATITVTTTVDELADELNVPTCSNKDYNGGAGISLAEAICLANNNGAGSNTITLPAGIYTFTKWPLADFISSTILINGAGALSTIVQANANPDAGGTRLFRISGPGGNLTINGLTVRNGRCTGTGGCLTHPQHGGGIFNEGSLTVTNCTFSGNSSTAGNGGAIYSSGSLTVSNSTFSSNHVADYGGGGAIFIYSGTASVSNSTFYANAALGDGAGGGGNGGGIFNGGTLSLVNVTISANSVAGTGNGGGIFNNGTLNYTNTISANSTGADCYNFATIGTNTRNLVEDNTCSPDVSGDPNLGSLTDNGGPTQTMELLKSPSLSPAIDAGTNSGCPATDQRGVSRPQGQICDIGAFEVPAEVIYSNGFESL